MSFYANIPLTRRYGTPRTYYVATVHINTNIPGYDTKFKAAIHRMNAEDATWRDKVLTAADQGWAWAQTWMEDHWTIRIQQQEILSGTYLISIKTTQPHSWPNMVRHIRAMINERDASWRYNWRMPLCLGIEVGRPTEWPLDTIGHFQLSTIKQRAKGGRKKQRRE